MSKVYVALGSNLNNPASQIQRAFLALAQLLNTNLVAQSSLYQSAPVGYDAQPDFINAVVELNTFEMPKSLLKALLKIEQDFGRERPFANAPRVLDLDLLLFDDIVLNTKNLTLPHPRMWDRAFVMLPLAEIAPDLTAPNGDNIVKYTQLLMHQGIRRLE
jgi:2-amino-4-hydroxy-6-hydroxymethyldihydropteridine diphosphokinase